MANLTLSLALKQTRADAIAAIIGAGGLIKVYSGPMPASPDVPLAAGNTLLSTLTGNAAAFASSAVTTGVNNLVGGIGGSGISPASGTVALTFSGGGGTGAAGLAIISGGAITGYTVTASGSGYTSPPAVTLAGGSTPVTPTVVLGVVLAASAITPDSAAVASGEPAFARISTSAGVAHVDVTVGPIGSDAGFQISKTVIAAGDPVACSAFLISED